MVALFVYYLFHFICILIIIECLLSWIPNIDRSRQPYRFIHAASEIFLAPVRMIIPPIGGLDLSPIVALLILQLCGQAICSALVHLGL